MKTLKSITILFFVLSLPLFGQTYSLKQCLEYAKQNNSNIKIAYLDSDISGKVVNEQIGKGLPQINITGTLEDKLKIATQLLPGELMGYAAGTFIPVKFGTKYNASGTLSLTQKIFDGSFWVGLKAAKISESMSEQNIQKTEEQTAYDVSSAYYRALIIQKRLKNLKIIQAASENTLKSTELKYQNGLAQKIDVENHGVVKVSSRRGDVILRVLVTEKTIPGVIFIPFHFVEAAANLLTNDALDPEAKIPEFKACAVKIEKSDESKLPDRSLFQPRGRY